jgi:hypothetical protein
MHIPQSNPGDAPGPDLGAGRKVTETHKALLWKLLSDDATCPSRLVLHAIAETPEQITVTLRQINRLRKAWGPIVSGTILAEEASGDRAIR